MADCRQGQIPVNQLGEDKPEILIEGPYFEDFTVGDDFSDVPAITITEGYAAIHQAVFGDRLKLPLDHQLCKKVTGEQRPLVNPSLVTNLAIGQSTIPSQRVLGNLFYRGLYFQKPVFIGDTLKTRTRVIALKQNKSRPGRAATGMVGLEMHVSNQNNETVLLFWRCPMIPCRDPDARTGRDDDLSIMPESIENLERFVPGWNLAEFKSECKGLHGDDMDIDQRYMVDSQDTVTLAPEIVRLTLNLAMTHTDAGRSVYGKRLVYGGHTISIAAAQLTRALPNLVTILAWYKCDHTAPVFEGDILQSRVTIEGKTKLTTGYLLDLKIEVYARRGDQAPEPGKDIKVLLWHLAALVA